MAGGFVYRRAGRFPLRAPEWRFPLSPPPPNFSAPAARGFQSRPQVGAPLRAAAVAFAIFANTVCLQPAAAEDPPASRGHVSSPIPAARGAAAPTIAQGLTSGEPIPAGDLIVSTAQLAAARAAPEAYLVLGRIPPPDAPAEALPPGSPAVSRPQFAPARGAPATYATEGRIPPPDAPVEALPPGEVLVGQAELRPSIASPAAFFQFGRAVVPSFVAAGPRGRGHQGKSLLPRARAAAYETTGRIPPPDIVAVPGAPIGQVEIHQPSVTPRPANTAYNFFGRIPPPDNEFQADPSWRYTQSKPLYRLSDRGPEFMFGRIPPPRFEALGTGRVIVARPFPPQHKLGALTTASHGRIPPPRVDEPLASVGISLPQLDRDRAASLAFVINVPALPDAQTVPTGALAIARPQPAAPRRAVTTYIPPAPPPPEIQPLPSARPELAQPLHAAARRAATEYETVANSTRPVIPANALPEGRSSIAQPQYAPARSGAIGWLAVAFATPPVEPIPAGTVAISRRQFEPARPAQDAYFRFGTEPREVFTLPAGVQQVGRSLFAPLRGRPANYETTGRIPPPDSERLPAGAIAITQPWVAPRIASGGFFLNEALESVAVPTATFVRLTDIRGATSTLEPIDGFSPTMTDLAGGSPHLDDLEGLA